MVACLLWCLNMLVVALFKLWIISHMLKLYLQCIAPCPFTDLSLEYLPFALLMWLLLLLLLCVCVCVCVCVFYFPFLITTTMKSLSDT